LPRQGLGIAAFAAIFQQFVVRCSESDCMETRLMRALFLVGVLAVAGVAPAAAAVLAPNEIQSTFFTGQPFTSATPSNVKFKMVFTADGKMTREPAAGVGARGEGTWKLTKEGFCTTWKGSKANCFRILTAGENKWSVVKGTTVVATWTK
jgi:hypothetical protein